MAVDPKGSAVTGVAGKATGIVRDMQGWCVLLGWVEVWAFVNGEGRRTRGRIRKKNATTDQDRWTRMDGILNEGI